MEQIRGYMQMLIWMMLFVVIIEMIFPDTDYRKYVKMVLGCILVYTMLRPIIGLLPSGNESYETYIQRYEKQLGLLEDDNKIDYQEEVDMQQEGLKEVYRQGIKTAIEKELQIGISDIEITCDEEMSIKEIYLTIGDKKKKSLIEIVPIHIGNKSDTIDGDEEKLKNKIKTCLNNFYNVQDCNIYITVQKN
ncbi:stage III sporulation protein AF [Cellulosilyticum ruminicola]|uniref:stage III sporulation protein AF n=1 Tax=Cellulosilyticum ruminicola TaxID=425254 RepID=UPI0006D1877E|nr:stage III sporulation protein AF [Cellulosilyticum ruminicola]